MKDLQPLHPGWRVLMHRGVERHWNGAKDCDYLDERSAAVMALGEAVMTLATNVSVSCDVAVVTRNERILLRPEYLAAALTADAAMEGK